MFVVQLWYEFLFNSTKIRKVIFSVGTMLHALDVDSIHPHQVPRLRAIACLALRFDACVTDAQSSEDKEKAGGRSRYRFASLPCSSKRGRLWDVSKSERSSL